MGTPLNRGRHEHEDDRAVVVVNIDLGDYLAPLLERMDRMTTGQDQVQAAIAGLKQDISDATSRVTTHLSNLEQQIQAGADQATLLASLNEARSGVQAIDAAAAPPAPPAPGPGPEPAPAPAPTNAERTLYTTDLDPATVDTTTWPPAPFATAPDNRPLFYFSGDTAPGQENGAQQANWHVYTGDTQPRAI